MVTIIELPGPKGQTLCQPRFASLAKVWTNVQDPLLGQILDPLKKATVNANVREGYKWLQTKPFLWHRSEFTWIDTGSKKVYNNTSNNEITFKMTVYSLHVLHELKNMTNVVKIPSI